MRVIVRVWARINIWSRVWTMVLSWASVNIHARDRASLRVRFELRLMAVARPWVYVFQFPFCCFD